MRITGGSLRSRKLNAPKGPFVEPAPDMVREAIFSILRNVIQDARVLDLFACSGSFGIEALSRGAEHVLFVEKNASAVKVIEQNLESLGIVDRAEVICADALEVTHLIEERDDSYDLVFVDPPYALSESREGHASLEQLLVYLIDDALCDGLVVFRQRKGADALLGERGDVVLDTRIYGSTQVTFFQPGKAS